MQISVGVDGREPSVLWVTCSAGRCLVDTCSDISLARRDALRSLVPCRETVEHLGGETLLSHSGIFSLDGSEYTGPFSVSLLGVFAVEDDQFPCGFVALLGVCDLRSLSILLDYVMANPGCDWRSACVVALLESVFGTLALGHPLAPPLAGTPPPYLPLPGRAPPCLATREELSQETRDGPRIECSSSAGGELAGPSFSMPASPPVIRDSACQILYLQYQYLVYFSITIIVLHYCSIVVCMHLVYFYRYFTYY